MTTPDQTQTQTQIPPKKKRGCFFYGCMTSLVLLLVAGIVIFFGVRYGLHKFEAMVTQYTQPSPMPIEKVALAPDDLKALNARVDTFTTAMNTHSNVPPLVLTGPEINALLDENAQLKPFKNAYFIALDGDKIKAQLSLPLDNFADQPMFKMFNVKGRYLNGSGTFTASITDGKLSVSVQSVDVEGKPLPENVMVGIRQQNLADGFNKSANPSPFEKYQSIEVKNSTVIITPKAN
jgi:hypothetical protein